MGLIRFVWLRVEPEDEFPSVLVWFHPSAFDSVYECIRESVMSTRDYGSVQVSSLKFKIARFELRGPKSSSVVSQLLNTRDSSTGSRESTSSSTESQVLLSLPFGAVLKYDYLQEILLPSLQSTDWTRSIAASVRRCDSPTSAFPSEIPSKTANGSSIWLIRKGSHGTEGGWDVVVDANLARDLWLQLVLLRARAIGMKCVASDCSLGYSAAFNC